MNKENHICRNLTIVFVALTAVCAALLGSIDQTGQPLSLTLAASILLGLSGTFILFCFVRLLSAPRTREQAERPEAWRTASKGERTVRNGAGTK